MAATKCKVCKKEFFGEKAAQAAATHVRTAHLVRITDKNRSEYIESINLNSTGNEEVKKEAPADQKQEPKKESERMLLSEYIKQFPPGSKEAFLGRMAMKDGKVEINPKTTEVY
jgi:hypothetical protein